MQENKEDDLDFSQWVREDKPRKLKDLIDNPKNSREIEREQFEHLKYSIKNFGLTDEPLINFDGRIIAGHMRKKALLAIGRKEIFCKVPPRPISEKEYDELGVRHNLNTGRFDFDALSTFHEVPFLFECGFTADDLHLDLEEEKEKPKKKEKTCPHCGETL